MKRHSKRQQALATGLAALAGYVDAIGVLKLGGLFVSFMSGNSTRMSVDLVQGSARALLCAGLIGAFLGGVILGAFFAHLAHSFRKPVVLGLVAAVLTLAALVDGAPALAGASPFALAAAMGAMNCVFQRAGEVSIGVTYMTGALVKLGQHLAAAMLGQDRFGWVAYLALWCGLVGGAVLGAILQPLLATAALWAAAAVALVFAAIALGLGPAPENGAGVSPA